MFIILHVTEQSFQLLMKRTVGCWPFRGFCDSVRHMTTCALSRDRWGYNAQLNLHLSIIYDLIQIGWWFCKWDQKLLSGRGIKVHVIDSGSVSHNNTDSFLQKLIIGVRGHMVNGGGLYVFMVLLAIYKSDMMHRKHCTPKRVPWKKMSHICIHSEYANNSSLSLSFTATVGRALSYITAMW